MTEPQLAILLPCYGNQAALNRTIASLADESVSGTIIIVDDGSPTALTAPLNSGRLDVVLLRLEVNAGITRALNFGLEYILSHGFEYVARLDAGDLIERGRLAKQLKFLTENQDYALVGGQARFVDDAGQEVRGESFPTEYHQIRRIMHARHCFIHPTIMMRSATLQVTGVYSEEFETAQDYELIMRISRQFPVANLEDIVLTYVIDSNGISLRRRKSQVRSRIRVMLMYFDYRETFSYVGLAKNLPLLLIPRSLVQALKRLLPRHRTWL